MISIKLTNKTGPEFEGLELTEVVGPKPRSKPICFSSQDAALEFVRKLLDLPAEPDAE